jgi:cytosine deaminase
MQTAPMRSRAWPDAEKIVLRNASVPNALLKEPAPGDKDRDGVHKVDIVIEHGRIAGILPAGSTVVGESFDADGGQVWPLFADLHTHLDKNHIWPRARNLDGTLASARASVRADTIANWEVHDVASRFEFALKSAYAHGTGTIRTHIDCFVQSQAPISFGVFKKLRDEWAGRIELQATALVSVDLYDDPENAKLVDLIAEHDARLGGVTFRLDDSENPALLDVRLDRLFKIAKDRKLDVDLHVDETGARCSKTLAQVAMAVLRSRFAGQVTCGHCCSLSVIDEKDARKAIELAADSGLNIVSLPLVNQYLQGRQAGMTPRWRGISLLRELRAAGVNVAVASDNCRDPYHPFGDMDLLEVFEGAVRIGHLDLDLADWTPTVTTAPAAIMANGQGGRLSVGRAADFIVFSGRNFSELLARHEYNRIVVRAGKAIDTSLPDFRTLDHLMPPAMARTASF